MRVPPLDRALYRAASGEVPGAALAAAKDGAAAVETAGGTGTALGKQQLWRLDRRLVDMNVSPGGSADLLAAALFLDAVEYRQDVVQADQSL